MIATGRAHKRPSRSRICPQTPMHPVASPAQRSVSPARLAAFVLWATISLGLGLTAASLVAVQGTGAWLHLLPLLALGVLAALLTVDLLETHHERFTFSFGIAAIMTAVAVAPLAAPFVAAVSAAVTIIRTR